MKPFLLSIFFLFTVQICAAQTSNLYDYNSSKERNAEVVLAMQLDSLTTMEKVVLDGFDSKIPFYHYVNKQKENAPYVFLLHGLGDSKECWVNPSEPYLDWSRNTTAIKNELLSLGYNILIPDAKFHGERSYELGFRSPQSLPPAISKNEKDSHLFESLMTSSIKDFRIIMDYIENRNSSDQIFNAVGYSMGSNIAILLSIFDGRINSVVACVPPINLPARGIETLNLSENTVKGQFEITPMTFAENQKAPILLLMGEKDWFASKEEVNGFMEQVATSDKELKFFDAGHILPNEYKSDVIRWISAHNK